MIRKFLTTIIPATILICSVIACGGSDSELADLRSELEDVKEQLSESNKETDETSEQIQDESEQQIEEAGAIEEQHTGDVHEHDEELEAPYLGDYLIADETYGTQTTVTLSNGIRTIQTNALPNHDTGDFPNSGNPNIISAQSASYSYPITPTFTGTARAIRVAGIAVNGIKLEPGTAETVSCASGETYRVEGLQNSFSLGMDFNNAHVQPTGEYHYHGLPNALVDDLDASEGDLVHIGFAADGHLIYASKSGQYLSGYELSTEVRSGVNCTLSLGRSEESVEVDQTIPDGTYTSDWVYTGSGNLDECNGVIINGEYAYLMTETFPYIPRCLKGEFTEGQGATGEQGPRRRP